MYFSGEAYGLPTYIHIPRIHIVITVVTLFWIIFGLKRLQLEANKGTLKDHVRLLLNLSSQVLNELKYFFLPLKDWSYINFQWWKPFLSYTRNYLANVPIFPAKNQFGQPSEIPWQFSSTHVNNWDVLNYIKQFYMTFPLILILGTRSGPPEYTAEKGKQIQLQRISISWKYSANYDSSDELNSLH